MSDNIAVLDGFTVEIIAESTLHTLELLVRPDTDYDSRFKAWDMHEQEFIWVNGWNFTVETAE